MSRKIGFWTMLAVGVCCGIGAASGEESAASYPSHAIRIIAPFAPGAQTDTLARFISTYMSRDWNQPVIVENKPGASGEVGTAYAATLPGDGYTLVVITSGLVINPYFSKLPYDPIKDFEPVVHLTDIANLLVVYPEVPVKTVPEFVKMVKESPGKFSYATSGAGGSSHMTTELFKYVAGLDMAHVPYRGGAPAIDDLIGGHIKIAMSTVPTALPFVKSGQARPIAVSSAKRSPALPDVPTLVESGYPEVATVEWFGVIVPAGTPLAIREKLNTEINKIMNLPEVKEKLDAQGMSFVGGTIDDFGKFISAESVRWGKVIKEANIEIK
jgi:tripartite-type tricarboxylate transporter receptor subunit TctC